MFNCKFVIAQLATAVLVSVVATAHAQDKAEAARVEAAADAQPANVGKSSARSRYGNGSAIVSVQAAKRSNQRVRANTGESAARSTPVLGGALVSTPKSVVATKRSRYPANEVEVDSTRIAGIAELKR